MLAVRSVHSELAESDLYRAGALTYLNQSDFHLPSRMGHGRAV